MRAGFMPMRRRGHHWKLVRQAVDCLRTTEFFPRSRNEHAMELAMVTSLKQVPELEGNLFTQLRDDPITKVRRAELLGFSHRPDCAIGEDGTAIELKRIRGGNDLRAAIGQGIMYRVNYRYVVLCLVDKTSRKKLIELAENPERPGHEILKGLAEVGIFTVIAPRSDTKASRRNRYDHLVFME